MKKNRSGTPETGWPASVTIKFFEISFDLKYYWPSALCAIIIFFFSVSAGIQLPETGLSADKAGHFAAYALLAWLTFRAVWKTGKWSAKTALTVIILVSAYGILLEFIQWGFFPHRFFEIWDMIANIIGAIASYFAFKFLITKT